MGIILLLFSLALLGFCVPLYKKLNPNGFWIYCGWCAIIEIVWVIFLFCADTI